MDWAERGSALRQAFTPAQPVQSEELFSGRHQQLLRVIDTLESPGEHAAVYGERGVGKTSLAAVSEARAAQNRRFPLRLNCQANDEPPDVWNRLGETVSRKLRVEQARGRAVDDIEGVAAGAVELLTSPSPRDSDVLTALEILTQARPVVVFLDEFDRLGDTRMHSSLVDMMKTVADVAIDVTFVVVGVAATVDGLIDEHESIGRGLNEIEMPRMNVSELRDILERNLARAEMRADDRAAGFISRISMGLPHYTHLLGLQSGLVAVESRSQVVQVDHVVSALPNALGRAQQHVSRLYHEATHSTQANIFSEVLLSAALTRVDERGYFAPGDMRVPLSAILGRPVQIPSFARHLGQFSDERGPVLETSGQAKRPRYRFTEALLVPFVVMRGISDGLITPDDLLALP